ncbi:tRNA (guanine-N(7)-)-methyltransferase [Tersicoccus solisilvae]|uniref:tRNA (guanine-N(7)-)-methyltransferase n=1 Tax=Tersicoccus solisilvae TaxID=1882339 RepID=A0ABQ1NM28_9MICC|nr:tRNA (guanine-N(7)-)-methyltransferase [Tersicoccus solisilvae]
MLSFVRRGTRLQGKQLAAWERLSGRYLMDVPRGDGETSVDPAARLDAAALFGRRAPLIVEIGAGLGDAVVAAAAAAPETDFIALDVYRPGLSDLMRKADRAGATNIRVIEANAPEVFGTLLRPGSVDEVWMFFPDPWPKKRHHKRRLVSPSFADLVARVLRPGGRWRLATDWEEYAEQMRETLGGVAAFAPANDGADGFAPRFAGRIETGFERKGIAAGRIIRDLTYVRR